MTSTMFGKGMDLRKWTGIITNLINIRKNSKNVL